MTGAARVRLVPLTETHLEATLIWVNDPVLMRLLGRRAHVEAEEHRQWFAQLKDRQDCRYFAVETLDSRRHVGNVWLWNIDSVGEQAEVRILFGDEASRGRGYGSEAINVLAAIAFDTMKLRRLYAYVFGINPRAKRAFEKAGFTTEALLQRHRCIAGEWMDVYVLARMASRAAEQQPLQVS